MLVGQCFHLFRGEPRKNKLGNFTQHRIAVTIDPLETFEEKQQLLKMHTFELFIRTKKRMRHCMRKIFSGYIPLQIVNIFT